MISSGGSASSAQWRLLTLLLALLAAACGGNNEPAAGACVPNALPEEALSDLEEAFGRDPPRGAERPWFVPRAPEATANFRFGVQAYGAVAVADLDGDGLPDVLAGGQGGTAVLFRNLGDFAFEDAVAAFALGEIEARSLALADLDNDGDLDLVASTRLFLRLFRNDAGQFVEQTALDSHEVPAHHLLPVDIDGDGLLDLFASHPNRLSIYDRTGPNQLLRNLGDLQFEDVTDARGVVLDGLSWAAAAFDHDEDGDQDIFVANDGGTVDFGQGPVGVIDQELPHNVLLDNQGGSFVDRASELGMAGPYSSMGALVEDFDGDGAFDVFIPDYGANKLLSRGGEGYVDRAGELGIDAPRRFNDTCEADSMDELCLIVSWGGSFEDFDLDGQQELLLVNHEELSGAAQPPQLFAREGEGYRERSLGLPNLPAHALASVDLDDDGDLDVVASTVGEGLLFFENIAADDCRGSALTVSLVGSESNRQGIGSVVEVTLDDGSVQRKLVGAGGVAHASLPARAHFGLGAGRARALVVRWPSGNVSEIDELGDAQQLVVSE